MLIAYDARSGQPYGEPLAETTPSQLDQSVRNAHAAFATWQSSDGQQRAQLLDGLADALNEARATLVALADTETGLGAVRLQGELDRTCFQLRRFGEIARRGDPLAYLDDPAVAGAPPAGHPAMMRVSLPLGPVAMFAASNFPFAFSVLGGDTASALAAGCSVVVKAHPGHPHTSQRVYGLTQKVLAELALPTGVVQMVQGASTELGVQLVQHPLIAAGAFTGSTRGGTALYAVAQARPRPIPFYGELGAINPVVASAAALQAGGAALAQTLAASITQGCGQFCTNPGLLILPRGAEAEHFVCELLTALQATSPHTMLTAGMRRAFDAGLAAQRQAGARALLPPPADTREHGAPAAYLAEVDAATFIAQAALHEEVFGPASLIVWTETLNDTLAVLAAVQGSLTVTLWGADAATDESQQLVRAAMALAGRVLFAGVPTGVAVTSAQHHGGPWPASTAPATTSVGDAALARFLRPVALQDPPSWLRARAGLPV